MQAKQIAPRNENWFESDYRVAEKEFSSMQSKDFEIAQLLEIDGESLAETTPGATRVKETHVVKIETPAYKTRSQRKLLLANGMKVLIYSDTALPMSAAGLANRDGSWQNPKDALGLAHFNEHMVFMGTKKYPKPSAFDSFLEENGAQASNAATTSQITQYAFSVGHDSFSEALDMFTDMFVSPLFTDKGLKKEINAVNQEYEMHKDDDMWRQMFVQKATANPKHPYHQFSIGTLKSLGKVDHKKIKSFYEKRYSSNLMSACVYTKLPLDKAEELVVEKFGRIPNRKLTTPEVNEPILNPAMKRKAVWQKSKTTQYSVMLQWELPKHLSQVIKSNSMQRPDRIVSYVLNHLGENSLFTKLQKEGLAHSVGAAQGDKGFTASLFNIQVSLTPKGFKEWPHVVDLVFQAITKLKKHGVPKSVFDTLRSTDLTGWKWQWRTDDVFNSAMTHAANVANEHTDFASYPYVDSILEEWNPTQVSSLLEVLHPKDMVLYGLAPEYPEGLDKVKEETESHYHTQWKTQDIPFYAAKWANAKEAKFLEIPGKNPYLAKELKATSDLMETPPVYPVMPHPTQLIQSDHESVHHWQDTVFGDPYVTGTITMKTDKAIEKKGGVGMIVASILMSACLNHAIIPKMNEFSEAGYIYSVGLADGTNLALTFKGTNPNVKHYTALVKQLAGYLKELQQGKLSNFVDEQTFQMLKTSTVHTLENALKSSPSSTVFMELGHMIKQLSYPVTEQIKAAKALTFEQVAAVAPQLFHRTFFEGFFAGQITPDDAKAAWKPAMDLLFTGTGSKALPKSQIQRATMRKLPQQPMYKHKQGSQAGNAAVLMIDAGGLDCKGREALAILYSAIPNQFYAELRSKQQTGYLVQASSQVMVSHHNVINFVVQSSKYKPGDLLHRYGKFLDDTLLDLNSGKSKTLSEKRFNMIKSARLAKYLTPNLNVGSMVGLMTTLLDNYDADFETLTKKKAATEEVNYDDVLEVAKQVHGKHNRRQIAVVYTKDGDELDQLPKQFAKFDGSKGKFITRKPFQCNYLSSKSLQSPAKDVIKTKHAGKGSAVETGKATEAGDMVGPASTMSGAAAPAGIKEASADSEAMN